MSEDTGVLPDAAPAIATRAAPSPRTLVALSLIALYLIWGSTYFAIRVALTSYPPFLMAGIRFIAAGSAMYAFLRWRGVAAPTRAQWINVTITGTLLLGLGNGLVCFAEQGVASGLAAVAVASMPLFAAVFGGLYGHWPRRVEWIGLGIGFVGVVLLNVGSGISAAPLGAIALIISPIAWAFGSVWSKHRDMPPAAMNTGAQMVAGGIILTAGSLLFGERITVLPSMPATLALIYLAVMGSIVAFTAYVYLLGHTRPALATSYAYVNPPVALLVGATLGGETVSAIDIAAMAVILGGVGLITLAREKRV